MKVRQENQDLRDYARFKHVALWQIAAAYGVHEMTLISRLRKPFDGSNKTQFKNIVDGISGDAHGKEV